MAALCIEHIRLITVGKVYLAQSTKGDGDWPTRMDSRKRDEIGYKPKSKTNHKTRVQLYFMPLTGPVEFVVD